MAARDMSERQLADVVAKFGFQPNEYGIGYVLDNGDDVWVPYVRDDSGKIRRRATLAALWREYDRVKWGDE